MFPSSSPSVAARRVLLCTLCLALTPVVPARAADEHEGREVAEVRIEGLVTWDPADILRRLKTQRGRPFNRLDLREDMLELDRLMRRAEVYLEEAEGGRVRVRFEVEEFPRLRQVQVIGNKELSEPRVLERVALQPGDPLSQQTLARIRRSLRNEYRQIGLPQARIELKTVHLDPPSVAGDRGPGGAPPVADLQLIIDEGTRVVVRDLIIRGNEAFSDWRLRWLIETSGSWWFFENFYDDDLFEDDLDILRDFYTSKGYFSATVRRGTFRSDAGGEQPEVSPVIEIHEGRRYRIGAVEVRGARLFSRAEVASHFEHLPGRPFEAEEFNRALAELRRRYEDQGFLTTRVQPRFEFDPETAKVDAEVLVQEGERIYLEDILLRRPRYEEELERSWFGRLYDQVAPPVKDETILREVLLEPGDVYARRFERESRRRLSRLGVFDEDALEVFDQPTGRPARHNMVIQAEETNTGNLTAGVGWGDVTQWFVFATFEERNLGGEANRARITGTFGFYDTSVVVGYMERYLGTSDYSLNTEVFWQTAARPGYNARTIGGSMDLGHPLGGDWRVLIGPRIEHVRLSEATGIDAEEDLDRRYGVLTGRLQFVEDARDKPRGLARRGHLQSYLFESGYAGAVMVKLEAMREQYYRLADWLTLNMRASAGYQPYDRDHLPIHERYFLGGGGDLRGFRYRSVGYRDEAENDVPLGGAVKLLSRNELLFPIYEPLWGAVFADAGMLGRNIEQWQTPRATVGTGIRFDLDLVYVGVDFAWPVVRQREDEQRFFHFRIQGAF